MADLAISNSIIPWLNQHNTPNIPKPYKTLCTLRGNPGTVREGGPQSSYQMNFDSAYAADMLVLAA